MIQCLKDVAEVKAADAARADVGDGAARGQAMNGRNMDAEIARKFRWGQEVFVRRIVHCLVLCPCGKGVDFVRYVFRNREQSLLASQGKRMG